MILPGVVVSPFRFMSGAEQTLLQNSAEAFYPGHRAGVREVSGYHPVGDRPATGFCVGLSCRSPGGGARVSIGANAFAEFCKSKTPPCPQAWFSRAFAAMICFLFRASSPRDGRHVSGYGPGSGRAVRAVRGRGGRLRAALWRLRDALSGSTGNGFVSGALLPLVASPAVCVGRIYSGLWRNRA